MIPLFLSLALAAAPVPKGNQSDGSIAILNKSETPTILLFTPNGEELKRVPLKGLTGDVSGFRLGKNRKMALVETKELVDQANPQAVHFDYRVYVIDLVGTEKPRLLFMNRSDYQHYIYFILHPDSQIVYCSQLDPKSTWDPTKKGPVKVNKWQWDLNTGKKQAVDLQQNHCFVDITADGETVLSWRWEIVNDEVEVRSVLLSTKTWKETFVSHDPVRPRSISPDGKWIFTHGDNVDITKGSLNPTDRMGLISQKRTAVPDPEPCDSTEFFVAGTNGRVAVVSQNRANDIAEAYCRRVYVMNADGTNVNLIYEAGLNEEIGLDWK